MKQEKRTELTKEKIIMAATKEFGTNGYNGASLNAICDAGISKGLLYHNYENKDAVYLACVKRCFETITAYLKNQQIGTNIQKYMSARLSFFRSHEAEAHLFFEALLQPPALLREQIADIKKEFDNYNQNLYLQILSTVTLRSDVTQEDALSYFSLIQNMFNGYFSSNTREEVSFTDYITAHEEGLSKLIDYMLYGIAERGIKK